MNQELRSKLFTALMHGVLEADIKELGEMAASDLDAIEPILKEHFTPPKDIMLRYDSSSECCSIHRKAAEAEIGRWYLTRIRKDIQ